MALDGGVKGAELAEILREPLAREHGRAGDREASADRIRVREARGRAQDVAERVADRAREDPAGLGEDDAASRLLEERDAERLLQAAQLVADGAVRQPELGGRLGEALSARRDVEGPQRREGEVAVHAGAGLERAIPRSRAAAAPCPASGPMPNASDAGEA